MYNCYFRAYTMNSNIVFSIIGDVNGDRIPDYVFLTGISTPGSPFIQNITLVVRDGRTGRITRVPLSENAGYNPRVFLGDFNGDGVNDILVSIDSGGSGAIMYHYIYSFINNIPQLIFDFNEYNEEYKYDIIYKDNYKVEAVSRINNEKYIIDISLKGDEYLSEIYDENGKLKEPIIGFVNPLSGLYPVDFDSNGVYELLAYQKIAGRYNADSLGYFLNTLKWDNNRFVLYNQNVAIWGADKMK
ncbi:FG-GAP repeat domain-containing protein [Clostridium magnum]|uniref:FG-GAP repeat protein n=1 Tax=Clostridium magnum DSM 2767 TaxID=1121326 RepID=A0A161YMJ5_9CLOT|nr:VCBS repeat-containing protein [Clostridium magnum]KZL91892.1 FG-GAP repeat protein [Clostridium magnum DSM 2767]SHI25321.1 Repeat domain-containing protein [Clostridium magnum DSM 2767]